MRKHLFVTLLLLSGMPLCGVNVAMANPEPQSQSQAAVVIRGTVLDENNEPVIGASVVQKGTKNAAATDVDGHFSIKVAAGTPLVISYVGYKTVTEAAAADMMVYMQPTTEMLNELVAIGYGSQKRANLTGAVSTVDVSRTMESRPVTDVTKALQGAVPGLSITTSTGEIGDDATMRVRGLGTLSNDQSSAPLIVVDGVVVDDLAFLNGDDIAEISVLKDAASASIYGTRAAFGVILVTTKNPDKADRISVSYSNNFGWSQATVLPEFMTTANDIRTALQSDYRQGGKSTEIFGMYYDKVLPYAEAWERQNGGVKSGYRELMPFQSWDNVGDYAILEDGSMVRYTDWDVTGILYNTAAPSQKHNVSLEGRSGRAAYRLSFGYDERQGLMNYNPETMKRYMANANVTIDITKWLKAGTRINFSQRNYHQPNTQRNSYQYIWRWPGFFNTYGWSRDEEGNPMDWRNEISIRKYAGNDNTTSTQTRLQAFLEAQIVKGLTVNADFTYQLRRWDNELDRTPYTVYNNWTSAPFSTWTSFTQANTYAYQSTRRINMWTTNVFATYAKSFNDVHNLKVMLGFTAEKEDYNYFLAQRMGLLDYNLPVINMANGDMYVYQNGSAKNHMNAGHRATAGWFGRVNYDYKGIYLLEFNGRYDGSSRFPAADQWAFFPSGSIGYRFSEEGYFKPLKSWWSNGKLRASYGEVGNEAVGNNMFLATVESGTSNWLNASGQYLNNLGLPKLVSRTLSWERICTTDVGVDLGFFNNSLNVGFDWYQRDTKDMLARGMDLPSVLGTTAPYTNAGALRTRGWEISASWNHSFGDADIYISANLSDATTKVTRWNGVDVIYSFNTGSFYEGGTYGDIWGFETDRFFEESDFTGKDADGNWIYAPGIADQSALQTGTFRYGPGDIKFADLNGDGVINNGDPNMVDENGERIPVGTLRNHGDLKVIGNQMPRYEYSFRIGGAYKGFDLDLFFQGVGKRKMWSTSSFVIPQGQSSIGNFENQSDYNTYEFTYNPETQMQEITGYNIDQNNWYPGMYAGGSASGNISNIGYGSLNFYPQTKYLMNMAYLRLKSVTLGYTLPIDLTRKAYIQKARIYFTAENPCLLYNGARRYPLDPEITGYPSGSTFNSSQSLAMTGRAAPMMRTYSFGIQVSF